MKILIILLFLMFNSCCNCDKYKNQISELDVENNILEKRIDRADEHAKIWFDNYCNAVIVRDSIIIALNDSIKVLKDSLSTVCVSSLNEGI